MTKKLRSTKDLIEALRVEHKKSNLERRKNKLNTIKTIFLGKLF